jgi:hypothetical protein
VSSDPVHVLLFDAGSDTEGIHSLELNGRTVVLLFEDPDDAERYAGLLEAQDFERFCAEAGYEARHVPSGFLPRNDEDRLLIAPPEQNLDVSQWRELSERSAAASGTPSPWEEGREGRDPELEAFRRRLEGLL